jgi:hypothetical protein
MNELLAHLVGDYVLQNHWMANHKTKSSVAAAVHVALYVLPFLLITSSMWALIVIGATHFLIDRFRLAQYWVDFWGTGKAGWLPTKLAERLPGGLDLPGDAPPWLGVWLLIIVDNTLHLLINHFAIGWL